VSGPAAAAIVKQTKNFSLAYLKELFVGSMTQWMSNSGKTSMDEVVLAQVVSLRTQMNGKRDEKKRKKK
jgi:hypothetical protein